MTSSRREAVAVAPRHEWIVRAWKWGAGSLSAGAALVSILSSVRSITGAEQVRWIGVTPAVDTAFALGDTVQLATTITDGHGGVLPGVRVGWTSTDTLGRLGGQRGHGGGPLARRDDDRGGGRRAHRAGADPGPSPPGRDPARRRFGRAAARGRHGPSRRPGGRRATASGPGTERGLALGRRRRGDGRQPGPPDRGDGGPHGGHGRRRRPHRRAAARGLSGARHDHRAGRRWAACAGRPPPAGSAPGPDRVARRAAAARRPGAAGLGRRRR